MEIKKIVEILSSLPEDAGLNYPENWMEDSETEEWRKGSITALKEAVKILKSSTVVGTLTLDGKTYTITK